VRILRWAVSIIIVAALPVTPGLAHDPKPANNIAGSLPPAARDAAATVDAFHAAMVRGDEQGAAALLADHALIYEGGGVERSKAEYMSHHLPADTAFAKAVARQITSRSGHAAGQIAWIATETTSRGAFRDRPIDSTGTETMVLERGGRNWRIVHIHWSSENVKSGTPK
jgi:ketosteroid isomerase-like protein